LLVLASFAIALMAGFTGLTMTQGASALPLAARKARVAASAIVLGGGIWSMHFVAMLGLQLPVLFYYDALTTLISALTGILIVGLGLIILHFRDRSPRAITFSGLVIGSGILAMHFIGMAGMQACRATYTPLGIAVSGGTSLLLGTLAVWVAYGERTRRNTLLGTIFFAAAVVALHYIAIAGTRFFAEPELAPTSLTLSNQALALLVTLAAFAICGGFLLSGATFFPTGTRRPEPAIAAAPETPAAPLSSPAAFVPKAAGPTQADAPPSAPASKVQPVPYEKSGRTHFVDATQVAAFRAEGHYTMLYFGTEKVFCPWSISEAGTRLSGTAFIRAHRSYLINPLFVSGFERKKDSGIVYFDTIEALGKVPVSRSRLAEVREALGL
jgi:NO-binding membrane sensor protein with MHYT domain